jgi:hypothetical protein
MAKSEFKTIHTGTGMVDKAMAPLAAQGFRRFCCLRVPMPRER